MALLLTISAFMAFIATISAQCRMEPEPPGVLLGYPRRCRVLAPGLTEGFDRIPGSSGYVSLGSNARQSSYANRLPIGYSNAGTFRPPINRGQELGFLDLSRGSLNGGGGGSSRGFLGNGDVSENLNTNTNVNGMSFRRSLYGPNRDENRNSNTNVNNNMDTGADLPKLGMGVRNWRTGIR